MSILTLQTISCNGEPVNGQEYSAGQVVTFILLAIFGTGGAIASIWGLVKWVVPRVVEARLTEQKDAREHRHKLEALQTEYHKAEAETTYQMMGSLLENSQAKEDKANEFFRTLYFNAVDQIKTNTAQIPEVKRDIGELKHQFADFATKLSLLIDIFQDDYNRRRPDESNLGDEQRKTGGNIE